VRSILRWLEKQKDEVDKDRMALAGHGDGASVALLAAGRERGKVSAMALLGGVATSGADLVIEQQQHILSQMEIDDEQRAEKLELQRQIHEAVIKGTGWADLPPGVRQAADTPWFYSFLTFDPGKAMRDTRQPILILQGELDKQVAPHHADDLAAMARDRKGDGTVEVVKVPGVNHLLVEATTGEVAEYASLGPDAEVAGVVTSTLTTWLTKVLK